MPGFGCGGGKKERSAWPGKGCGIGQEGGGEDDKLIGALEDQLIDQGAATTTPADAPPPPAAGGAPGPSGAGCWSST